MITKLIPFYYQTKKFLKRASSLQIRRAHESKGRDFEKRETLGLSRGKDELPKRPLYKWVSIDFTH